MREYTRRPGAGLRRLDKAAAQADRLVDGFRGLPEGVTPAHALAALKRAAPYMQVAPRIVQMLDTLFAWTRADDWRAGRLPIVWPRNEKLAHKLGLGIRQVQKLLDHAQMLGFIAHKDSPNGHRGGVRGEDGRIKWAYGIVLAPLGTRYEELVAIAERGAAEDEALDRLHRRLASARRKIRALAQGVVDHDLIGIDAETDLALALLAVRQLRRCRDVSLLEGCVEQLEHRQRRLELQFQQAFDTAETLTNIKKDSCSDESEVIHSTTTNEPLSAKADHSSGFPEKGSSRGDALPSSGRSDIEEDLDRHGIGPDFISEIAPDLCHELAYGRGGWGPVVALAERLANQTGISRHAWREACRLMGDRGAAASVIATVQKYRLGDVRRPGAYLRGISGKAAKGELHLGRTFHALKDLSGDAAMRSLASGSEPASIGHLIARSRQRLGDVLS